MINFEHIKVFVVGDLMLDEYIWGTANRISPEAPVPVVLVDTETNVLGGAGNVAANLVAMGASVAVAGVVGSDQAGMNILQKLAELGVNSCDVNMVPDLATTVKTRIIAAGQQMLRIDKEVFECAKALQGVDFPDSLNGVDVVIISDYAKGAVTHSVAQEVINQAKEKSIPVIVDPKGSFYSKYAGADIITPNQFEHQRSDIDQVGFSKVVITRGDKGVVVIDDGVTNDIPARARTVFDVSGAGDTFISVLALCVAAGFAFQDAVKISNEAAGFVVGKVGTATITPQELREALTTTYHRT